MRVSWTWTQAFFSRYLVFHLFLQAESLKTPHWGTNPLCFTGLWYYWRIVPQDTTESCPGTVPLGKVFLCSLYLVFILKILVLTVVFSPNSGYSCLTPSSARSCCCHRVRMWTTELRVSAIETSSRSVTCAPFVYQVSFNPSLNKQMWARGHI